MPSSCSSINLTSPFLFFSFVYMSSSLHSRVLGISSRSLINFQLAEITLYISASRHTQFPLLMFLLGLVSFDLFSFALWLLSLQSADHYVKTVVSTFTFNLLPDRLPNATGSGRRSRSRTHTKQIYKAVWRTIRTSCVYCFLPMTLRDETKYA